MLSFRRTAPHLVLGMRTHSWPVYLNPPRVGMTALLENEQRAMANFAATPVTRAESFLLDGDRAAINWVFEYSDVKGRRRRLDEIAYQIWSGDKIIRERFFYDPASGVVD
jgi:hypothetical protein